MHFSCDATDGSLKLANAYPCKGHTPRNFMIVPDGTGRPDHSLLVVANQDSHNIVVYAIDAATGALRDTGAQVRVPFPAVVAAFA